MGSGSVPVGCFSDGFSGLLGSLQGPWGSLPTLHSFVTCFQHLLSEVQSNPGLSNLCLPDTFQVLSPANALPSILLPAQGHFSFPGQAYLIFKWGFPLQTHSSGQWPILSPTPPSTSLPGGEDPSFKTFSRLIPEGRTLLGRIHTAVPNPYSPA